MLMGPFQVKENQERLLKAKDFLPPVVRVSNAFIWLLEIVFNNEL